MAKNMARIDDGVVVNIEWCADSTTESDVLKDIGELPVQPGDEYTSGCFYRDGERLLTPLEAVSAEMEDMRQALAILEVEVNG